MRYLGIDIGQKRTGLAVADDVTGIATPLETIVTSNPLERIRRIRQAIEMIGPGALVIGLPLNMDGTEGPAAQNIRSIAKEFGEQSGLPIHLVDERLTSHAAEALMDGTELSRAKKKVRVDSIAAAMILNEFLQNQNP